MATAFLVPLPRLVFYDANGAPLAGGFVYTYTPGGTVPKTTWQDAGETTPNSNPIQLDAVGSALVYGSGSYQLTVTDSLGNAIPAYSGVTGTFQQSGVVATIAALRALNSAVASPSSINIEGYYAPGDGGGGTFAYVSTDTSSGDNGGTIIVDAFGNRWYRQIPNAGMLAVIWFGAKGDGTTDDTTAVNAALAATSPGDVVSLVGLGHCLVSSSNVNIPAGVSLVSGWNTAGNTLSSASGGQPTDLATLLGSIVLSSTFTINMGGASGLKGVPIYRQGLTTPAANADAFAGTAVTIFGDDCYVGYCLILGFAQAITSTQQVRGKFEWVYGDNQAGIQIINAFDTPYLHHCHFWPYCTYSSTAVLAAHHRTGTAYRVDGTSLPSLAHLFSFAYKIGYELSGSGGAVLVDCQADNDPAYADTIGFALGTPTAGITSSKLIGCTAFNCITGYFVNTNVGDFCEFSSCSADSCNAAVNLSEGSIRWIGGAWDIETSGISVLRNDSAVVLMGLKVENVSGPIVFNSGGSTTIYVSPDCDFDAITPGATISSTMILQQVSSASPLVLPLFGDTYSILGTSGFGLIESGWAGRKITLLFADSLIIVNSIGDSGVRLTGGANFTTAAGSTLSLVHNGAQWFETGRCV